ncbi:caspase [Galleria mellonella]|uniref:Caspase n=1 Tax=Galleria mellonella TaxID=7137 RepID=A0A6J1W6R3_GALME|nr:caspase [Galleria mellonella]
MDDSDASPFGFLSPKAKTSDQSTEASPTENQASDRNVEVLIKRQFDPNALYYDMSGKKYLLIFNQYKFQSTVYFRNKRPPSRLGTFKDVDKLNKVFKSVQFEVSTHTDLQYSNIKETVTAFIDRDHSNTSCICITFLTHGNNQGDLYAADRPFSLQNLTKLFEDKRLATIPKLFFIQACRGDDVDDGNFVETDALSFKTYHIPSHIDFLTLYPTVEGLVAFRDSEGSWMIQELCKIIETHYRDYDILQLITLANKAVAFERTSSNQKNLSIHEKKQTLETKHTLTKFLKFA